MGKEWDKLDGQHLKGSRSRPETVESAQSRSTRGFAHGIHAGKPTLDLTCESQKAMQNWHLGWLQACFDILPSGGLLKVFGATRTFHRLAAAMEEAGFLLPPEHSLEAWGYGSGFPKYLNTSKAIDAHLGKTAERKVTGVKPDEGFTDGKMSRVQSLATGAVGGEDGFARPWMNNPAAVARYHQQTAAASPEAAKFDGWATALKPGWEPFVVGIKP